MRCPRLGRPSRCLRSRALSDIAVVSDSPIDGVVLTDLLTRGDDRGSFTELFRSSWFPTMPKTVQANLSVSKAGVLRGMHYHREQTDYWCPLAGKAFVVLFDLRAGSPTQRITASLSFNATDGLRGLLIPAGVAHGFCAISDMKLLYMVDAEYTGEDESGFAWNDPGLGIAWPAADPVVSERDRHGSSLESALADPPRYST
jgi:dTDP-4-dehydrorhamnose 3,5-epimerase